MRAPITAQRHTQTEEHFPDCQQQVLNWPRKRDKSKSKVHCGQDPGQWAGVEKEHCPFQPQHRQKHLGSLQCIQRNIPGGQRNQRSAFGEAQEKEFFVLFLQFFSKSEIISKEGLNVLFEDGGVISCTSIKLFKQDRPNQGLHSYC